MNVDVDIQTEIALLRTGYLPTPVDASHFRARIAQSSQAIDQIDNELASLMEQMDALKGKRERLLLSNNVAKAHVAPIRRLPVEILQHIFEIFVPEIYYDILSSERFVTLEGRRLFAPKSSKGHQREARTTLSLVCYSWSNIISNMPGLWSSLIRQAGYSPCESELQSVHSGPIDAIIQLVCNDHDDFEEFWSTMMVGSLYRIRVLNLFSRGALWIDPEIWSHVFPFNQMSVLPVLRILNLNTDREEAIDIGTIHAPNLRWLSLSARFSHNLPHFTPDSLSSLNVLILNSSSHNSHAVINGLNYCRGITILRWTITDTLESWRTLADSPATLCFPSLKDCTIHLYSFGELAESVIPNERPIPCFNAPTLEIVRIGSTSFGQVVPEKVIIESILEFETHFISNLCLAGFNMADEHVSTLLLAHSFPALQNLTFTRSTIPPCILLSLMPCGPLYDAIVDRRPLLSRVNIHGCMMAVVNPDGSHTHPILLPMRGCLQSHGCHAITDRLCITVAERVSLSSQTIDDIQRLIEVYNACCSDEIICSGDESSGV